MNEPLRLVYTAQPLCNFSAIATVAEKGYRANKWRYSHDSGNFYRPQRSWAKVMFLQASVILLTWGGVCLSACWDAHPPGADTPLGADTPRTRHPPGTRHPHGADTPGSRHPPRADTPWEQTPPRSPPGIPPGKQTPAYGQRAAGTHPTGMHSCIS